MIKLYCTEDGRTYYVAPAAINWVSTTSDAETYHGRKSKVSLIDGTLIYCTQDAENIATQVEASQSRSE